MATGPRIVVGRSHAVFVIGHECRLCCLAATDCEQLINIRKTQLRVPGFNQLRLVSRQYPLPARFDTIPSRPGFAYVGEHRALGLDRLAERDVVAGQIGQLRRGDSGIVR